MSPNSTQFIHTEHLPHKLYVFMYMSAKKYLCSIKAFILFSHYVYFDWHTFLLTIYVFLAVVLQLIPFKYRRLPHGTVSKTCHLMCARVKRSTMETKSPLAQSLTPPSNKCTEIPYAPHTTNRIYPEDTCCNNILNLPDMIPRVARTCAAVPHIFLRRCHGFHLFIVPYTVRQ